MLVSDLKCFLPGHGEMVPLTFEGGSRQVVLVRRPGVAGRQEEARQAVGPWWYVIGFAKRANNVMYQH